MARIKWTEDMLRAKAAEYNTRSDFKRGCGAAFEAARTKWPHLIEELFPVDARSLRQSKWTLAAVAEEATKYVTRKEFSVRKPAAYIAAVKNKWLDEVCGHMRPGKEVEWESKRKWTEEAIRKTAAACETRGEFFNKYTAAARAAKKLGIYEEVCASFKKVRETWTPELIAERAAKFNTLADFYRQDPRAYEAMLRYDMLDTVGKHLEQRRPSDEDSVYLWRAIGMVYNGKQVYKIGVTSARIGDRRIKEVALRAGLRFDVLCNHHVGKGRAANLERYLLSTFGEDPCVDVPDGRTEFRALTDEEVKQVVANIHANFVL